MTNQRAFPPWAPKLRFILFFRNRFVAENRYFSQHTSQYLFLYSNFNTEAVLKLCLFNLARVNAVIAVISFYVSSSPPPPPHLTASRQLLAIKLTLFPGKYFSWKRCFSRKHLFQEKRNILRVLYLYQLLFIFFTFEK